MFFFPAYLIVFVKIFRWTSSRYSTMLLKNTKKTNATLITGAQSMINLSLKTSSRFIFWSMLDWAYHYIWHSEDDEEDEDEEHPDVTEGQAKQEDGNEDPPKSRPRQRTPSYELHMYSVEELARFKKREMIADSELLDGKYFWIRVFDFD